MGNTLWLQVSGRDEGAPDRDNSIMLALQDEIDRLADRLGVARPSSFYDCRALAEDLADELGDDIVAEGADRAAWFPAAEGRRSLEAPVEELRERPSSLGFKATASRSHWPAALMEELGFCARELATAEEQGRGFRFLIVA